MRIERIERIEHIARIGFAALAVALLTSALPASAQNPCLADNADSETMLLAQSESGFSGTGRKGGDESGIGGTGLSGSDESGIGGTGYQAGDESGIGGTGVFGTITAFGSICVNGLRVHYDDATPVNLDGQPANARDLAIGQVVAVSATGEGEELQARRVTIHSALAGPITAIDAEAGVIEVMGARVIVSQPVSESDEIFRVGSRVSVSGLRRADGSVIASLVTPADQRLPDRVAGLVQRRGDRAIEVGRIRIEGLSGIAEGDFVRVTGTFDERRATLTARSLTTTTLIDPRTQRVSVEGYLQEIPSDGRLLLPGIEIERSSLERALAKPERDLRIRVEGRRDRRGRVQVERVHRVERPRAVRAVERADRIRANKPEKPTRRRKPGADLKPDDRPDRRLRPDVRPDRPPRPPRIDRPPKLDRPTAIDSLRESRVGN